MKTDDISERYADQKVGLILRLLQDDEGDTASVLIEGSQQALRMLAELLLAVADEPENEGFSISPFGAGKTHFSELSELGLYIHRSPGAAQQGTIGG
ncbi:hypothetical protein [Variovorax sp. JS1663]|uniref:hypothetical protein n=1 Tax=Variovorax sp. JS1663 TaxID=1851577 RepID=UPI000B343F07|nr:hypothetical protein [Variovorax sp. JS1663]OUL97933.1 hypothetical protein A8M77_34290 [Variovorax sp. JS1663]